MCSYNKASGESVNTLPWKIRYLVAVVSFVPVTASVPAEALVRTEGLCQQSW